MEFVGEGVDVFADADQSFAHLAHGLLRTGPGSAAALDAAGVDGQPGELLCDVVVQFASEASAFCLLGIDELTGEGLLLLLFQLEPGEAVSVPAKGDRAQPEEGKALKPACLPQGGLNHQRNGGG